MVHVNSIENFELDLNYNTFLPHYMNICFLVLLNFYKYLPKTFLN